MRPQAGEAWRLYPVDIVFDGIELLEVGEGLEQFVVAVSDKWRRKGVVEQTPGRIAGFNAANPGRRKIFKPRECPIHPNYLVQCGGELFRILVLDEEARLSEKI